MDLRSRNSSRSRPKQRFKNWTKEKTPLKNTDKQQETVAVDKSEAPRVLTDVGIDDETVKFLSEIRGLDEIKQQVAWIDEGNPRDNKLGMLQKAIAQLPAQRLSFTGVWYTFENYVLHQPPCSAAEWVKRYERAASCRARQTAEPPGSELSSDSISATSEIDKIHEKNNKQISHNRRKNTA